MSPTSVVMVALCAKYFILVQSVHAGCWGDTRGCKEFASRRELRSGGVKLGFKRNHTEANSDPTAIRHEMLLRADREYRDHLAHVAKPNSTTARRLGYALPLSCILLLSSLVILLKVAVAFFRTTAVISSKSEGECSMLRIIPLAGCWTLVAAALAFLNKYTLMPEKDGGFGFPYPLSLGVAQMFANMMLTRALSMAKPHLLSSVASGGLTWGSYTRNVVPVGLTLVLSLVLSNAAYRHHSYIQVLKAAGPLSIYVSSCVFGIDVMRWQFFTALGAVALSVALTSTSERPLSMLGFLLQIGAFICHGVKLVLQKIMVSPLGCKLDPLSALYYFAPVCFLGLTLLAAFVEPLDMVFSQARQVYVVLAVNVLVAFALQVVSIFLLWYVSATTYSLCSVVGDVGLVCIVSVVLGAPMATIQRVGYASAACGVLIFSALQEDRHCINRAFGYCDHQETKALSAA